ncbi:hypothetical protein BJ322DRAFT_1057925 [Thelephora terrestris]|uniref:Uncharacterized protein n=1 Tax=Thelephora terrestris TaxID=56493 RepID=A0A9P6HH33_9AGAM|nr:hypothetical protein BJ322DRAFT_1057925 [Thelephora terrestris]
MNSTVHHPQQLIESSWRILEATTSPSLREILAAFRFSKGQDGDCQLLLALLNAKSAEDQRTAAIANLHARLLESQSDKHFTTPSPPPTYSIPRLHIPSPVSPPRSRSPYSPSAQYSDSSYEAPRPHRSASSPRLTKKYRRSPYERLTRNPEDEYRHQRPKFDYDPRRSPCSPSDGSDSSSPRSRETMSIGTLLSSQNPQPDDEEPGVSSERSTSRKLSP